MFQHFHQFYFDCPIFSPDLLLLNRFWEIILKRQTGIIQKYYYIAKSISGVLFSNKGIACLEELIPKTAVTLKIKSVRIVKWIKKMLNKKIYKT